MHQKNCYRFFFSVVCSIVCCFSLQAQDAQKNAEEKKIETLLNAAKDNASNNSNKALQEANEALELSKQTNFEKGIARAYGLLGIIHLQKGNYPLAATYYDSSINLYQTIKDSAGLARSYSLKGVYYGQRNRPAEALKLFLASLKIRTAIGDKAGVADLNLKIGLVYDLIDDLTKAENYTKAALQYALATGNDNLARSCYNNLGIFYGKADRYPEALEMLNKAMEYAVKTQDEMTLADVQLNMGNVYVELKKANESIFFLNKALNIFSEANYPLGQARTYNTLARAFLLKNNLTATDSFIYKSIVISKELENDKLLYDNYSVLLDVAKARKDLNRIVAYYDSLLILQDINYTNTNKEALEKFKNEYEMERKETAIALLKQQNKASTAQRNFFVGITIMSILVIIGGVLMYKNVHNKNQQLAEQKKSLEELNLVKNKFFAVLSHDLRTPINSILSIIDLLEEKVFSPEEEKLILEQLRLATGSTLETMETMLVWGRNHINNVKVEKAQVNIHKTTAEIIKLYTATADKKQIQLVNLVPEELEVSFDKDQLSFIIRNLVANAVKFSPSGKTVKVQAIQEANVTRIVVTDEGVGMKADKVKALLTQQETQTTKGTFGETGIGLGLNMVKEFVAKNSARLAIESEENKGSSFSIIIES